ncbi:Hypothetical protein, putative [Bodo saltans]|uniref:Methyltransferase n=1 Tax=Bodo saltans TaxID=75058 RepID=A0A0S4IKK0_BODSA|nr:Hypothetical protein, putative [Bodo saltans]|eukprot:CUF09817.1 Hypothetical protein, putative [Bodo saltans]
MKQLELVPLEERKAFSQLHTQFKDMEALVDELREVLRVGRSDSCIWRAERTLTMLQWCQLAGSCGGSLGLTLQQSCIPDVLTRCSTELARLVCLGVDDLDHVLDACTAALSNACGGSVRALSDVVLREEKQGDMASSTPSDTIEVVVGFADYSTSETGGRLWAGAVVLAAWFHEQRIWESWCSISSSSSRLYQRPLRVCEIGCGPALVSASLCAQFCRTAAVENEHSLTTDASDISRAATIHLLVTDVSPAAVTEADKTIRHRNGCSPNMIRRINKPTHRDDGNDSGDVNNIDCGGSARTTTSTLEWSCDVLDFSTIPKHLEGQFDIVFGSDVVYDFTIAAFVPKALIELLRPGTGVAYLCCESQRDAMKDFVPTIQSTFSKYLVVEINEAPQVVLKHYCLPTGMNPKCSLMKFRRTDVPYVADSE